MGEKDSLKKEQEKFTQEIADAVKRAGFEAKVLMPDTPEYDEFIQNELKPTPEQEVEFFNLENKILLQDINIPAFKLKTEAHISMWREFLSKNTDPYGRCCLVFANLVAAYIEKMMLDSNKSLENFTKEEIKYAEKQADEFCGGITGFMYSAVLDILSKVWYFGEDYVKRVKEIQK